MEQMPSRDTPVQPTPIEALSDADTWARIESIQPQTLAVKLEGLLSDQNIQRAKQAEINRYTTDIRTASSATDRKEISISIDKLKKREEEILEQVSVGNGQYAKLDMQIRTAKARGKETKLFEDQMAGLINDLAPLQGEYEKVCMQLDWLQGSSVMLEVLATKQEEYIVSEAQSWELSTEYKAAFGQLILALDRLEKLPQRLPIPIAPPDMSTQNPTDTLPLSLDGQLEDKRQVFTVDIQNQIDKIKVAQRTQEDARMSTVEENPSQILSHLQLAELIPPAKISIPVKRRSRINELMKEESKA